LGQCPKAVLSRIALPFAEVATGSTFYPGCWDQILPGPSNLIRTAGPILCDDLIGTRRRPSCRRLILSSAIIHANVKSMLLELSYLTTILFDCSVAYAAIAFTPDSRQRVPSRSIAHNLTIRRLATAVIAFFFRFTLPFITRS